MHWRGGLTRYDRKALPAFPEAFESIGRYSPWSLGTVVEFEGTGNLPHAQPAVKGPAVNLQHLQCFVWGQKFH